MRKDNIGLNKMSGYIRNLFAGKRLLLFGVPLMFVVSRIYVHSPVKNLGLCAVKRMLDLNCPGCGFIRAVISLLNGDIRGSIDLNPMGIVAVVILVALWIREVFLKKVFGDKVRLSERLVHIVSLSFVAGLFIQWAAYLVITLTLT